METGGASFTKGTILFFSIMQLIALKLLLQRLQDAGIIEVPAWVPYIDHSNCGHIKAFEYVIISRSVVTPEGIFPAAG